MNCIGSKILLKSSCILVYGGEVEYDYKGVPVKYYQNHVTENIKNKSVA